MKQGNALALISRIRENANKFLIKELENRGIEGIVPSHGEILVNLFKIKKCTMKELAERIHRTKPTVTVLVDKLINYGYVEKEKSLTDSRITYIRLTTKGINLQPYFEDISNHLNAIVYHGLTEEEAALFEKMLLNLYHNFDSSN